MQQRNYSTSINTSMTLDVQEELMSIGRTTIDNIESQTMSELEQEQQQQQEEEEQETFVVST